jgi:hypothetical protein
MPSRDAENLSVFECAVCQIAPNDLPELQGASLRALRDIRLCKGIAMINRVVSSHG